jgi:hypothetical protein
MKDTIKIKTRWVIRRFLSAEFDRMGYAAPCIGMSEIDGNCLLNEGITALMNLLIGAAETTFANANAYIGVGDSDTAAAPAQTGLQASSNKAYKAMEATYPQIASQTVTFRSVFGSSDGNFAWKEFTVASGNSDSADNLNRKVSDQGTKASGQTWTVDLAITFS